jgi:hypothetical protein
MATYYGALAMRCTRAPLIHALLSCALLLACACDFENPGDPPPEAEIYLPTGLALSAQSSDSAPRFLYLMNSNYDLRYNAGSIQAFDLDALDAAVQACPTHSAACQIPSDHRVLADEVLIGSLATSIGFSPDHRRLYVAARTDASMTFIDIDETAARNEDVLRCAETARRCSPNNKRGNDASVNVRRLRLPTEPVGLVSLPAASIYAQPDSSLDGMNYVLLAHRFGQVSLFLDTGRKSPDQEYTVVGPELIDVREGLQPEITGVTFDPATRLAYLSVYARGSTLVLPKVLGRVGIAPEPVPHDVLLYDAGALNLDGVSQQRDTRAVSMNPSVPTQALVVSRDPAALLWADVAGSLDGSLPAGSAPARRTLKIGAGPSRLALGELAGRPIAAVSCFDSHEVFIVDTANADVLAIVHNLNGPFELAIDSVRKRLYVADFRSSIVQVMDLSAIVGGAFSDRTEPSANVPVPVTDVRVIATLGIPKAVQELQ